MSRSLRPPPVDLSALAGDIQSLPRTQQSLVCSIKASIESGRLKPRSRLPGSRELARELGVARATVTSAIELLIGEGYLEARHGSGTYVSRTVPQADWVNAPSSTSRQIAYREPRVLQPPTGYIDLSGRPSTERFPLKQWRRAWADAASRRLVPGYSDPRGEMEFRSVISQYIGRARGLPLDPSQVVVTDGAMQAVNLTARTLLRAGDTVAMEDPGSPYARMTFEIVGAKVIPVPVDGNGIDVDAIRGIDPPPRLVYVTPSHQFPTGARLSLKRRTALLDWARSTDGWIIEDDWDGEFRYGAPPLPPLASMPGSDHVVYVGTFSRTLSPSVRLGFAAGAPDFIEALAAHKAVHNFHTSVIPQVAVAAFIASGEMERHVARMRRLYGRRRARLAAALEGQKAVRLGGVAAGLHAMLDLGRVDEAAVEERLRERGVWAVGGRHYSVRQPTAASLLVGFAAVPESDLDQAIAAILDVRAELAPT